MSGVTATTIVTLESSAAMAVGERAQTILVEAVHLARYELDAGNIDGLLLPPAACAPPECGLHPRLLELARKALDLVLLSSDFAAKLLGTRIQDMRQLAQDIALLLERANGFEAGDCLDATDTRGDAALAGDGEEADVPGGAYVGAAAQLDAESGHRHHADLVTVLLPEERHCPCGNRLLRALHLGDDGGIPQHVLVDDTLDLQLLIAGDGREVDEVETQAVGRHERPGLFHVRAKDASERSVKEMRGRVVAAGRIAKVR
jgi:hypothetical protein